MLVRFLPRSRSLRPPGTWQTPHRIVLPPRPGSVASSRPPVRIFVGSEPEQHRAERVFLWSIEQQRDPTRVYEIFLMKELAGFARRFWLTGFTNYRFAIPELAGGQGRAIYNDVDQIYLADPAELFDLDMGGHGFLSLSLHETSVMLLDCARMASTWTKAAASRGRRKGLERRAAAAWGRLDPAWNTRDETYAPGTSKLLHYTTIHTQPWQPFPRDYVYQRSRHAGVWLDLERSADREGYQPFSFERPSPSYRELVEDARARAPRLDPSAERDRRERLRALVAATRSDSVLDLRFGAESFPLRVPGVEIEQHDLSSDDPLSQSPVDGVVCGAGLEGLSHDDVDWVLEAIFARARCFVLAEIDERGRSERSARWWWDGFRRVGLRHPDVHWLVGHRGARGILWRAGGRHLGSPPSVWILTDHKPGHTTQSVGLAEALGWPYEVKTLRFNALNIVSNAVLGATARTLRAESREALAPPWPDVVIATGRRPVPVARWIGEQSQGKTRLVQLGRRGANIARWFDAVVSSAHFRFPSDARRIETIAPLHRIRPEKLERAAKMVGNPFADLPRPHVALLVGGGTIRHRLDARTARTMGEEASALVAASGGTLFAVTSRRTGDAATRALACAIEPAGRVHAWRKDDPANPYLALLACADVLVVTGESESMLAEAVASGKPVQIYFLPERPVGPLARLRRAIADTAESRPLSHKGTVRPQQGVEYLCARLIQLGLVQPPRGLARFHAALIDLGVASRFGGRITTTPPEPLREVDGVAAEVERLLGFSRAEEEAREEDEPARAEGARAAHA